MSDFPPPPPPPGSIPPPPDMTPPPPYGGQGAPLGYGMPARSFSRIGGISKVLGGLFATMIVFQALSVIGVVQAANRAQRFLDGRIDEDAFETASGIELLSSVTTLLTVGLMVLTIIWMFRIAKNLRAMGRTGLSWAPGWAIGGWFLPPCIFVIPWLVLQELWKASDPDVAPADPSWKQRPVTPLLHVWWVLYGLLPIVGAAVGLSAAWDVLRTAIENGFDEANAATVTAQSLVDGRVGNVVGGLAQVAAAAIFMVIVRQLAERHMRCTGEA
ncbi:MAG: DUF4328 domain-containing protein [Ilumatobacteraceae bacterium]